MAKIGSTMINMPSLNFSDSNTLMKSGLEELTKALDPIKTAMDANFAERESNAIGSLLEQISQGMPQDYNNNPEARAMFDSQMSQYANNAGLAREGVNLQDVYSTLNEVGKARDANRSTFLNNQTTELANQYTQEVRDFALLENLFTQGKLTEKQFRQAASGLGVSTQGGLNARGMENINLYNASAAPFIALRQAGVNQSNTDTIGRVQDGLTSFMDRLGRANQKGGNSSAKTQAPLQGSFGNSGGATHGLNSQTLSYAPIVSKYAQQHGVPDNLVTAMIGAESSGKNGATSSANAKGLMQIVPGTWDYLTKGTNANIRNPEDNINYGTKYIKQHLDKYSKYGDKALDYALMAYNWGEGNVDSYIKTGKGLKGGDIPKETKDYLSRVKANMNALEVPDASQRNPFMDYNDDVQQATQRGSNSDYLTYNNQGQTRSLPANPQLETTISDVLASMGLTGKVHSGGQNDKTGRVGGQRHDHGNSVDMDFYKDGRKLSFKNKEDIPIYQEIVQRLKANGVTGFGAGEGYMADGRMHVGYGSPAIWGKDRTNATAAEWLKEAFNSDVSGFASTDQLIQQAIQPLLREEDLAVLNDIKERSRQGDSEVFNKLQGIIAKDIPNPTKINYSGSYYSPEMLAQNNQTLVDINEQMLNNSTQVINDLVDFTNDTVSTVAEREIMSQDAESRLNQISAEGFSSKEPLSKYIKDLPAFKKWLFEEDGITPEMFESFPVESQISLIKKRREVEKANSSVSRTQQSSVESFDSSRLNLDDSFYKSAKHVLTARHNILSRQKREQHEKENGLFNRITGTKTDTEYYLINSENFEQKVALAIDKRYKELAKNGNYRASKTKSISIFGSSNADMNKLMNYTIEEYDKIILSKKGSDLGYLSKNLTKGFKIESERTMNLAVKRGLERAAEEQQAIKDELTKEKDRSGTISPSEILGDASLQSILKGNK